MPEPISSNILEDFQAPPDAVRPFQTQLTAIRQAFAALDGKWLGVKLEVLGTLVLTPPEQERVAAVDLALKNLNNAITNRQTGDQPDQPPAKNVQITY